MFKHKYAIVLLAVLTVGLLFAANLSAFDPVQVRIKVERANVRQTAQMEAPVVGSAAKGDVFAVLGKEGDWYLIQLADGTKGYVHQFVVDVVANAEAAKVAPTPEETQPVVRPAAKVPASAPAPKIKKYRGDTFSMALVRVGYFLASDSNFTKVYSNGIVFGGEVRIGGESLGGWLEGNYRSSTGTLTYTKESTKMSVMAVEAGALYRFKAQQLNPYLGAGLGLYMFDEDNTAIGEAKKSQIGFCVLGGVSYFIGDSFVVDAKVKYSTCSMKPADFDINVGGITLGLGLGLRF